MTKTIIDDTKVLAELILDGMDLSPYDYSSITDMRFMFQESNITYELLEKANLDTSNVTSINSMFGSCKKLTTIPLLDTSNVTDMSYVFNGCENLTSIPKLDTSKVIVMRGMFNECSKLTTIPELDTSNVTDMSYMFAGCEVFNQPLDNLPYGLQDLLCNNNKLTNYELIYNSITNYKYEETENIQQIFKENCELVEMLKEFITNMSQKINQMESNYSELQNQFKSFSKSPATKKIADGKTDFNKVSEEADTRLAAILALRNNKNKK